MKKREQGILTIEASIVLTLMLLFILFLFSFGRVYRAQSLVSHASLQSADAVALESYLRETALQADAAEVVYLASHMADSTAISTESLESLRSADLPKIVREKFIAAIAPSEAEADAKLRSMGVKDGLSGIDFSACKMDLAKEDVIVAIKYTIEMQFPVFGFQEISATKAAKAKTFGEILYEVSTEVNHPGWGSTSGDSKVTHGSTVEISATPNYGYKFVGWDDNGDGRVDSAESNRTVTVTDAQHYTAIFEKDKFGINLSMRVQSSSNSSHSDYGTVNGAGTYEYLDNAVLKAEPKEHYEFVGWDDNNDGRVDNTQNPRTVTVDKTYNLKAVFRPKTYTVAVKTNQSGWGTAAVSQGNKKGTSIEAEYGSEVTLTAAANTLYRFTKWSNNASGTSQKVTVKGPATYTAYFEHDTCKITFFSGGDVFHTTEVIRGSSIRGSSKEVGATMPTSAPTLSKQYFTGWQYNGSTFSADTKISSDVTVTAQFVSPGVTLSGGETNTVNTKFTATTTPGNVKLTWSSSDTNVAEVNQSGTVKVKKSGTVMITVSFTLDGYTYEDSVEVKVGESEHEVVYCMNMGRDNKRYYTKEHIKLTDDKEKWGVKFPGTNHHCYSINCCGGHAKKTVEYSVLENSKIVGTEADVLQEVGKYKGYNKSGQIGYVFNNGSGNAIYFETQQTSKGPRGYFITKITHK